MADERQTQQIVGYIFIALMAVFLIVALTTVQGNVTWLLILVAVIFLVVGLMMLFGTGGGDGYGGGSSQQQSVVLSDGQVITQGSSGARVCHGCQARMPGQARFCPHCGQAAA